MNERNLSEQISSLRRDRGLTQEQLAARLGVTYQAVSKWENGLSCPDVTLLPALAEIFGVSIDRLFGRETPAEEPEEADGALPWGEDGCLRAVLFLGRRLLDERRLEQAGADQEKVVLEFSGTVTDIHSSLAVACYDSRVLGSVCAGESVSCGDVGGDVQAGENVDCGAVGGDVQAGENVDCGDVGRGVTAGGDVNCGNVTGGVSAGDDVRCGDVDGSVDAQGDADCGAVTGGVSAGGDVDCGSVGGDLTAGGDVDCGDVTGSVRAGGDVDCGAVGGSVSAEGDVSSCELVPDRGGAPRDDAGEAPGGKPGRKKFHFEWDF